VGTEGGAQSVIKGRKVVVPRLPERIPLMQIDTVGGYSAACGSLVYEGGAWPPEWNRGLFCTEPILNIIHHEALRPSGATFIGEMVRTEAEFLRSPDYWFRPVDVSCGPDGALYILDFYNPVIAHSDSRGPLHSKSGASVRPDREHYFGRIYRVQHQQAKALPAPKLEGADAATLAQNLAHPNRVVRFNALRLLMERDSLEALKVLSPLTNSGTPAEARMLALWGVKRIDETADDSLSPDVLREALHDGDASVRKTAALVIEAAPELGLGPDVARALKETDPRARLAVLRALAVTKRDAEASAVALAALWPSLSDDLTKSAALAAANGNPKVIEFAMRGENAAANESLVRSVAEQIAERNDAAAMAGLIADLSGEKPEAPQMAVLEVAARMRPPAEIAQSAPVREGLARLFASGHIDLSVAALPVAAKWKVDVKREMAEVVALLLPRLRDPRAPEPKRVQALVSLVGAHAASEQIWPGVGEFFRTRPSQALQRKAVDALGETGDPQAGILLIEAFDGLSGPAQTAAFEALLPKPEWTSAFLDAAEAGKVKLTTLGPANLFRLRSHPQKEIAERAAAVIGKVMKPNADKEKLIAQLAPLVSQPGNAARGKELFTAACAVCHKLGDLGKEIGPVLTGIGAHGPEQLLVSIVDPNRVIDAGYEAYNVETTDGQFQTGLLASENEARVVLRGPAGDVEVPKVKIKSSVNTHRSLMPEGFEGLGAEALRDILTFICGDQARFRVLELTQAFTADTRRGLYQSQEHVRDTLSFVKFGLVTVDGIPFHLADPARSALGGNVIVLRGGPPQSFAHTLPDRVEVLVNLPVKAFHFLGGVAGWGANRAMPEGPVAMRVTVVFADGVLENTELRNGDTFADYIRPIDVPGSQFAAGVVNDHQIRWHTVPVKHEGVVTKLVLESPGSGAATTTAAITAEVR
jgi:putative heme-binding domain-containing protein